MLLCSWYDLKMENFSVSHETIATQKERDPALIADKDSFLGDEGKYLSEEKIENALLVTKEKKEQLIKELKSEGGKNPISYDKYKKSFFINEEKATMGEIIASRHFDRDLTFPDLLEQSGEGKRVYKNYLSYKTRDFLQQELNHDLADSLAKKTYREDMLKSKAYEEIRDRSKIESKQMGVVAEKVMIGFAETIAIDRPDLGLTIMPGNAFLDVEQKIDFILETTHKKRGVGVDAKDLSEEHKSVGIQFTINTAKQVSKAEQIAKAKERGISVDDIVYVAIDQNTLRGALEAWEKAQRPIQGPWHFLPSATKKKAIDELFKNVLTPEQQESLLKSTI